MICGLEINRIDVDSPREEFIVKRLTFEVCIFKAFLQARPRY